MNLEALKYPTGKWEKPSEYQANTIKIWIDEIKHFPEQFSSVVKDLPESSLNFKYRPEGWTLRQLSHHVVDSHMNAYIRHKLAYTEKEPTITPYIESLWAELEDVKQVPIHHSLQILSALHIRWTVFLDFLDEAAYLKGFYHPEHNRLISIQESISMYAWHCRHHLAHAQLAVKNPY